MSPHPGGFAFDDHGTALCQSATQPGIGWSRPAGWNLSADKGNSSDAGSHSPDWTRSPAREQCYIVAMKEHRVKGAPANCAGGNFRSPWLIPEPGFGKVACWLGGCSWLTGSVHHQPGLLFHVPFSVVGCQMPWRGGGGAEQRLCRRRRRVGSSGASPYPLVKVFVLASWKRTAAINEMVEPSVKLRLGQACRSTDSFCSWFTNIKLQRGAPLASLILHRIRVRAAQARGSSVRPSRRGTAHRHALQGKTPFCWPATPHDENTKQAKQTRTLRTNKQWHTSMQNSPV